jgi:hypothetical protein
MEREHAGQPEMASSSQWSQEHSNSLLCLEEQAKAQTVLLKAVVVELQECKAELKALCKKQDKASAKWNQWAKHRAKAGFARVCAS